MPKSSPRCVPRYFRRAEALSPLEITSSISFLKSGNARSMKSRCSANGSCPISDVSGEQSRDLVQRFRQMYGAGKHSTGNPASRWQPHAHRLESRHDEIANFFLCFRIAYNDEVPFLAARTRCTSSGIDHTLDQVLRHRIGLQVTSRTASFHRFDDIHGRLLVTVHIFRSLKTR